MLPVVLRYGLCALILSLPVLLAAGCAPSDAGCCGSHGSQPQQANPQKEQAAPGKEADSGTNAALAKLSPEDRALAENQKVCPVTGARLGSMGVPAKVTVKGQTVFLCCSGCEEKLRQNADKLLTKLNRPEGK